MVEPFCLDSDLGSCMCKQLRNLSEVASRLVRFARALGKYSACAQAVLACTDSLARSACPAGSYTPNLFRLHVLRDPLQNLM